MFDLSRNRKTNHDRASWILFHRHLCPLHVALHCRCEEHFNTTDAVSLIETHFLSFFHAITRFHSLVLLVLLDGGDKFIYSHYFNFDFIRSMRITPTDVLIQRAEILLERHSLVSITLHFTQ